MPATPEAPSPRWCQNNGARAAHQRRNLWNDYDMCTGMTEATVRRGRQARVAAQPR